MSLVGTPTPAPSSILGSSPSEAGAAITTAVDIVDIVGATELLTKTSPEEKNVAIASGLSKGPPTAPNGMTPTPLPVRQRLETPSEPTPAAPAEANSAPAAGGDPAEAPPAGGEGPVVLEPATGDTNPVSPPPPAAEVVAETVETSTGDSAAAVAVESGALSVDDIKAALSKVEDAEDEAEIDEEQASTNSLKDDPGTPDECNLFVGDLARNLTEEKLEKAFQQHGKVLSVSIKRDRATGKNLGYGFVKLSSHQEARTAKEAMQGVELGGRRVRVGWAQKNTSLYVGGFELGVTTEMLVREFARFGPLDKDLTAIKAGAKFGFVKYRYRLHAETAKKELNERPAFSGLCPSLHIEWNSVESGSRTDSSETASSVDGSASRSSYKSRTDHQQKLGGRGSDKGGGGDASSQHSGNSRQHHRGESPNSSNAIHVQFDGEQSRVSGVNEAMIRKTFSQWEPVVDVVIPKNRYNGVSPGPRQLPRCWGFVHFPTTPEGERAAKEAMEALNGTTISDMKVHCTPSRGNWRKPGLGTAERGSGKQRRPNGGNGGGGEGRGGPMMNGQGFGGRLGGRHSMESGGGMQPGRGGWGGNTIRHNMPMQPGRLHPSQQHPIPPHMLHPHLLPPHHQHPQHPHHQHPQQQMFFPPTTAPFTPGQYPVPSSNNTDGAAAAAAVAGGGGGGGGEVMVQTPYGMAPYPYMPFQGVPYASTQAGYSMGYQQMYPGYPYPPGMTMDPSMMQGQVPAGVQAGGQQAHSSQMPQGQGQGGAPMPAQQQQQPGNPPQPGPQPVPQSTGAQQQQQQQQHQRPPAQLQAQQQHARAAAAQRQQQQQQQMGMQHPMMMPGHNPAAAAAAAAHGLNVGVPSYMPMYQVPQIQGAPGGVGGVPEQTTEQAVGGVEGKHGE